MMEPSQVKAIITSAGLPAAYRAWRENEAPALPYAVFYAGRANNFPADGLVYFSAQRYTIELYTAEKDPTPEKALEAALTKNGVFWSKDEVWIESENMNEIIYEIEV